MTTPPDPQPDEPAYMTMHQDLGARLDPQQQQWATAHLWLGAPHWEGGPPTEPIWLDQCDPDIEIVHRVTFDANHVAHAPRVKTKQPGFGTLHDYGYLLAWARPRGATEWPWVLLVWRGRYTTIGERHHPRPQLWLASWVHYNPRQIEPTTDPSPLHHDAILELSAAIIEALDVLG